MDRRHRAMPGLIDVVGRNRNAEIQQARPTILIDEHIPRLDISMNQLPSVRIRNRIADCLEQHQPLGEWQPSVADVVIDVLAEHGFHREPEPAAVELATIDQPCDARMAQFRENLALAAELRDQARIQPHDLERDLLLEMAVVTISEVHDRAAAATEHSTDAPVADTGARRQRRIVRLIAEQSRKQAPGQRSAGRKQAIEVMAEGQGHAGVRLTENAGVFDILGRAGLTMVRV